MGTANLLYHIVLWNIALPPINTPTKFLQFFLVSVHLCVFGLELNNLPQGKTLLEAS